MHKYMNKIIEKGKKEDMIKLGELFDKAVNHLKECDPELYDDIKMCMYELAEGKIFTVDMAECWVSQMKPRAKWVMEETNMVLRDYGLNLNPIDFYIVMNMLYSDMCNVLGDGNTEESIRNYVQATEDWLKDDDIKKDKLWNYYKYVAK